MANSTAMGTAYVVDGGGGQEQKLKFIADAGFSHIHWSFHSFDDFLYGRAELDQIARWLADFHLTINDIHGSFGQEKSWGSTLEYQRQAGVELVENRIDMAERFECDVVVMHAPHEPETSPQREAYWSGFRRALDALDAYCRPRGVRIAIENMPNPRYPDFLGRLFEIYPPDFLGLCYDTGHGNFLHKHFLEVPNPPAVNGLEALDRHKGRLIGLHLNDNDGKSDLHNLMFSGTVDWHRVAQLIAASEYAKPKMTIEASIKTKSLDEEIAFLRQAAERGEKFAAMVGAEKSACAGKGKK